MATRPILGEGHNFTFVPVIQFLAMPEYLLLGPSPDVTAKLVDDDLMKRQIDAFVAMEQSLAP